LENYVYDLVPTMPVLRAMPENFSPFYVFTAVRRFMFFLDPKHTGRIPIATLVLSRVMDDLLELGTQQPPEAPAEPEDGAEGSDAPPAAAPAAAVEDYSSNWFSAENALRVYSEYLELDADQNGMLSREELLNYPGSKQPMRLTRAFVKRVFEEIITYKVTAASGSSSSGTEDSTATAGTAAMSIESGDGGSSAAAAAAAALEDDNGSHNSDQQHNGENDENDDGASPQREGEMDYKTFLDFILAMENKAAPQALRYFWKLLDVQRRGKLGRFSLNYFFRDVVAMLQESGHEAPNPADVKDEIYDMVRPADERHITLKDLQDSGVGHTVVSMLIDANGFWAYDNRESVHVDPEQLEEDPTGQQLVEAGIDIAAPVPAAAAEAEEIEIEQQDSGEHLRVPQ
jgi:Ca2+-binding EF-hand superfamily protein